MTAQLLDGNKLKQAMEAEIAAEAEQFTQATGVRPGLAAVLVGSNPASQVYVRNKRKACERVGVASFLHELPQETTPAQLLDLVARLNADPAVHGILVQLPLPKQIPEESIIRAVSPRRAGCAATWTSTGSRRWRVPSPPSPAASVR